MRHLFVLSTFLFSTIAPTLGGEASAACKAAGVAVASGDRIAFLGDSITQFGNALPGGYVNLVMDGLARVGIKAEKIPAGVSGQKSHQMLARVDKDVVAKKPEWMVLFCGINDITWQPMGQGNELPAYSRNVTEICDKVSAAGTKILIVAPTFARELNWEREPFNAKLGTYCDFLRKLAKDRGYLLADAYAAEKSVLEGYKTKPGPRLTVDNLHLSGYGNMLLAACVLEAFGVSKAQVESFRNGPWRDIPAMLPLTNHPHTPKHLVSIAEYEALERKAKAAGLDVESYVVSLIKSAAR